MKQISVFLENKPGSLHKVLQKLKEWGINLRALALADTADFGVLRFIAENPEEVAEKLKQENFTATITPVIAVGVEDRPGGLCEIVGLLAEQGISIEYLYAFVSPQKDKAYVVLRVENPEQAETVLRKQGKEILEKIPV
ncbi:ACT domain-containing protein [Atrimonas thermophila]|jgi:hypothetical protein|uniref:ACT domain-containing protein n=1 Tax=Atrimonas thermophila TaxID=3064161 RepID=UPI00399C4E94